MRTKLHWRHGKVAKHHRIAAELFASGLPLYRALRAAGYSHWSACVPQVRFRMSAGLRQAFKEACLKKIRANS